MRTSLQAESLQQPFTTPSNPVPEIADPHLQSRPPASTPALAPDISTSTRDAPVPPTQSPASSARCWPRSKAPDQESPVPAPETSQNSGQTRAVYPSWKTCEAP